MRFSLCANPTVAVLCAASQTCVALAAATLSLQRVTRNHVSMRCYGLGLGLDTFRMVALDANFRRLEEAGCAAAYARCVPVDHNRNRCCQHLLCDPASVLACCGPAGSPCVEYCMAASLVQAQVLSLMHGMLMPAALAAVCCCWTMTGRSQAGQGQAWAWAPAPPTLGRPWRRLALRLESRWAIEACGMEGSVLRSRSCLACAAHG